MAALNHLPFETLVQILASLSTADLLRTSRICRWLSDVSDTVLYRSPSLDALRTCEHRPSLEGLIMTLIYSPRPSLGSHVRTVTLRWDRSSRLGPAAYPVPGWSPAFYRPPGFHGVHCVFLLHILPSVRVLHIFPPRDIPDVSRGYISHCLEASPGNLTTPTLQLHWLRKFTCPHATTRGGISFGALLGMMALPCIESIETHILDTPIVPQPGNSNHVWFNPNRNPPLSGDLLDMPIGPPPRSSTHVPFFHVPFSHVPFSPVKNLRLSANEMSTPSLAVLLRAPVALRVFSYSVVGYGMDAMPDFVALLVPQRHSLQILHLDLDPTFIPFIEHKADMIRGSLSSWPALHTMSCSARAMLGNRSSFPKLSLADVLPRSLGALRITTDRSWAFEEVVEKLVDLLRMKEMAVPRLESVSMTVGTESDRDVYQRLVAACEEARVRLLGDEDVGWQMGWAESIG